MQTQASSERFVDEVEKRWGVKFPEGRNPDLTFMAHLWEPLRFFPTPLHYPCAAIVIAAVSILLLRQIAARVKPELLSFLLLLLSVCLKLLLLHGVVLLPTGCGIILCVQALQLCTQMNKRCL